MNLQVGVKLLLKNAKDEYLVLKRTARLSTDVTDEKSWDLVGGRIEAGELLHDALSREIKEEIGYTIPIHPVLLAAQDIVLSDKNVHVVRLTYTATVMEDFEVLLDKEHSEYKWVDIETLRLLNIDPHAKTAIELIVSDNR